MNERSEKNLEGVHPDLVRVIRRAEEASNIEFHVIEGLRTLERQRAMVASGASRTMRSRHLSGHAVDLAAVVEGQIRWDWPLYMKVANAVRLASIVEKVTVIWGGTWKVLATDKPPFSLHRGFPDGPHFELPVSLYP